MYHFRLDEHHVHRSMFHSLRVQAIWVFLFTLVVPTGVFVLLRSARVLDLTSTYYTLALSGGASILTLLALRRIAGLPGAVLSKWIFPVLGMAFAGPAIVIFVLRIEYSAILLTFCFICSLLSFYVLANQMARRRRAVCYIVPFGRALECEFDWSLQTIVLAKPELPKIPNAIIAADMHSPMGPEWERLLTEAALAGNPVYHFTQLREAMTGQVQFDHLSENAFGAMIPALAYKKIKRLIDTVAALAAIPLLAPLLLVIGIAVKMDSPGPAFFRQTRMGHRGEPFLMFKFRTMTVTESGEDKAASVTAVGDARVTRLGRLLRPTRLDELPQVFNVLLGQMSWIGPRPEAVALSGEYADQIPYYRYRHLVRPGITGWAQVHQGHVTSVEDVHDKLRYDFYYVKNISFWIDMVIAIRTVRVILTGFGAK